MSAQIPGDIPWDAKQTEREKVVTKNGAPFLAQRQEEPGGARMNGPCLWWAGLKLKFGSMGAAKALGQSGDPRAVRPLLVALSRCRPPAHRELSEAIWEALLELGPVATDTLAVLAEEGPSDTRIAPAFVMCKMGDPRGSDVLVGLAAGGHPGPTRAAARAALKELGEAASDDVARVLGSTSRPATRCAAAEVLGEIGGPGAVPALGKALQDQSVKVRLSALRSLLRMGTEEALGAARAAVGDSQIEVWGTALRALGSRAGPGAAEVLRDRLLSRKPKIAATASEGLIALGETAVDAVGALFEIDNRHIRAEACRILGGIGGARAMALLRTALEDRSRDVRLGAAEALEKRGYTGCRSRIWDEAMERPMRVEVHGDILAHNVLKEMDANADCPPTLKARHRLPIQRSRGRLVGTYPSEPVCAVTEGECRWILQRISPGYDGSAGTVMADAAASRLADKVYGFECWRGNSYTQGGLCTLV